MSGSTLPVGSVTAAPGAPAAVKAWQAAHKLPATGQVDSGTWRAVSL